MVVAGSVSKRCSDTQEMVNVNVRLGSHLLEVLAVSPLLPVDNEIPGHGTLEERLVSIVGKADFLVLV